MLADLIWHNGVIKMLSKYPQFIMLMSIKIMDLQIIWRSRFGPWKLASVSQFTHLLIKTTGLIEFITSTSVEYELLTAMPSMTIWPTV